MRNNNRFVNHWKFYKLILDTSSHLTLNSSLYKTFPYCKGKKKKNKKRKRDISLRCPAHQRSDNTVLMQQTQASPRRSIITKVTLTGDSRHAKRMAVILVRPSAVGLLVSPPSAETCGHLSKQLRLGLELAPGGCKVCPWHPVGWASSGT